MWRRPSKLETPDGVRGLIASHLFLLADTVLVFILGVVWLRSDRPDFVVFVLIVAALAATWVEIYRRESRWAWRLFDFRLGLKRALAESDTLAEISKEFAGEVDINALFDLVVQRTKELLAADYASVATIDETTDRIVWSAAAGLRHRELWATSGDPGKGLTGTAISTGEPVVVEDFGTNPMFPPDQYPLHRAEGMIAASVMPILRGSRALGALTVGYRRPHSFSDAELASMEALAAQAGVALENARLYGEEKHRVAELEAVLDHMSEGVIVTDRAGRIVRCNEAARQLLGDIVPGMSLLTPTWQVDVQIEGPEGQLLAPEEWPPSRAAQGEEFTGREGTVRRGDATPRHISVDGRPVLDAKGEVVLGVAVIHDVTAAREMDQLKDEFLSLAAHELKTPLTSLKGYAQMLLASLSREPLGDRRRRALEVMDRQVDRVNYMVEQFLLVEEIRSGRLLLRPQQVDLTDVVAHSCQKARELATGHVIEFPTAGSIYVTVDAKSLSLVLSNLLDNAIKFSPQGSKVRVNVSVEGGEAVVCVCDSGTGIPMDKQGYIFERFYQVQPGTLRGVGLGLYISQELVTSHGGRMWLESQEGEGSRFYFALPLAAERYPPTGKAGERRSAAPAH